jgi:hypothetical protein
MRRTGARTAGARPLDSDHHPCSDPYDQQLTLLQRAPEFLTPTPQRRDRVRTNQELPRLFGREPALDRVEPAAISIQNSVALREVTKRNLPDQRIVASQETLSTVSHEPSPEQERKASRRHSATDPQTRRGSALKTVVADFHAHTSGIWPIRHPKERCTGHRTGCSGMSPCVAPARIVDDPAGRTTTKAQETPRRRSRSRSRRQW